MKLTTTDYVAAETTHWEPVVKEIVIFSSNPQTGVPLELQGKIGTVTDEGECADECGFHCCMTDAYVRSRRLYTVEIYDPTYRTINNPSGIRSIPHLFTPMLEPSAISWPYGDHLVDLRSHATNPTARILYTCGNVRLTKPITEAAANSSLEILPRCISMTLSHKRRFTQPFAKLCSTCFLVSFC